MFIIFVMVPIFLTDMFCFTIVFIVVVIGTVAILTGIIITMMIITIIVGINILSDSINAIAIIMIYNVS